MLISWIKQFIRVSTKGKFYTLVNILGLSVGLMCTIIILLWSDYQQSFDKFQPDYNKIFRVYRVQSFTDGYKLYTYSTPAPLSEFLRKKFPEIKNSTRVYNFSAVFGNGDKAFRESEIGFIDSTFFNIFKVDFISGNSKACFKDNNSIVLTELLAQKIFGSTDVIGKSVRLNGNVELQVMAVVKDYPKNSDLKFSCLIPFERLEDFGIWNLDNWNWNSFATYVKLNSANKIDELAKSISSEAIKMGVTETTQIKLQPIEYIRLYNINPNGYAYMFFISILLSAAGFVLLLACVNFINLITARAANRAKEVGIRKVIGSSRIQLVAQYFIESFLSTIISLFFAILLVDLALPSFNVILETDIKISFMDLHFWSKILIVVVGVAIASGIYPAFVLSSFQPAKVLKGILRSGAKGAGFRKIMVIFQYSISIILVVVTFFMVKQLGYISNVDTGMSRNNVLYLPFRHDMDFNYNSFKNELKKIPSIKYVTGTQSLPFRIYNSTGDILWSGKDTTQSYLFSNVTADEFLTDAMEIKMVEGRFFSSTYSTNTSCVVINEAAAKVIGKKQILGEVLTIWRSPLKVIGVMKNFNFKHLSEKIEPLVVLYGKSRLEFILVKAEKPFDSNTMESIKKTFTRFNPGYPFESTLLEDDYNKMFFIEKQMKAIIGQFSVIAILISCFGLLSLAAFIAEQQRKSLVLRKIHGASMFRILTIQLGCFTKWVLISGLIAIPLSYLALKGMLSDYVYHTELSWWVFAGAVGIALIIAVITVLFQALKTARVNPVEVLRYE